MADETGKNLAPHSTVAHAAARLQKALDLLHGKDWPEAMAAALDADRRGRAAKRHETRAAWMTVANLILVATQDETPFFSIEEPAKETPDDGLDLPF
jgi:hypothetical protein